MCPNRENTGDLNGMYKVLIVDDEPIILEGLKMSVRWTDFDCEVVGTASNGLEGLEMVRKLRPDILISDISMNNMDGLTMVAAIVSEYPDTQVTLLTGYRNFEYAQRAIRLGVARFLLKPSKMDEIEEAIKTMTDNLRSSGNMGRKSGNSVWDLSNPQEKYLYETFIQNKPDRKEEEGENRIRATEANTFIVKRALMYILEHYTEKLGLTDVAEQCYVSSWHLSKTLNQYTGRGFFELINTIRVDHAKTMLTETQKRIQDISEAVGFQDVAHFSRIFKSYAGMSPREYRTSEKESE